MYINTADIWDQERQRMARKVLAMTHQTCWAPQLNKQKPNWNKIDENQAKYLI
jgi:hypothetical protein